MTQPPLGIVGSDLDMSGSNALWSWTPALQNDLYHQQPNCGSFTRISSQHATASFPDRALLWAGCPCCPRSDRMWRAKRVIFSFLTIDAVRKITSVIFNQMSRIPLGIRAAWSEIPRIERRVINRRASFLVPIAFKRSCSPGEKFSFHRALMM